MPLPGRPRPRPVLPDPLPPLPRHNIVQIVRRRRQIVEDLSFDFYGCDLVGERLARYVDRLHRGLNLARDLHPVLWESCQELLGQTLTAPLLFRFAWRLAAQLPELRRGQVLGPYNGFATWTWVPWLIRRVTPARDHLQRTGAWFELQAQATAYAGGRINRFWTAEAYRFLARQFGFRSPRRPGEPDPRALPLHHPADFVRLQFYGLADPERSFQKPTCEQLTVAPRQRAANLVLQRIRARRDPCPRGYQHHCHQCTLGYALPRDLCCPAGTHRQTFRQGPCSHCGNPAAHFDPERPPDRCAVCDAQRRLARKPT